jgi:hypothetical protein
VSTNGTVLRQRHVGQLLGNLASDAGTLVRQEIELAKAELRLEAESIGSELSTAAQQDGAELSATAKTTGSALTGFAVAGAIALAAVGAVTAAAILVLHRVIAADVSALIVAVVLGLIAALVARSGRARLRRAGSWVPSRTIAAAKRAGDADRLLPQQTIETVKEDVQWVKTHGKSDAR